jgi:hypothetical protein
VNGGFHGGQADGDDPGRRRGLARTSPTDLDQHRLRRDHLDVHQPRQGLYRTLRDLAEVPYDVRNHNTLTSGNGGSEPARGSTNVYNAQPDGAAYP